MGDLESKVVNIIVDKLGVDRRDVVREASFTGDLGADSLDIVELVMDFEKEFGITIPDHDAEKIRTVGDALDYLNGGASAESSDNFEKFAEKLNEYLEKPFEIVKNIDSARFFLRECEGLLKGEDDVIQASYRFLQALCCLEYYLYNNRDKSLLPKGESCIKRALDLDDDLEYKVVDLLYQRVKIDADDPQAYEKHKRISDEFYLSEEVNYWLGIGGIRSHYEFYSWNSICDAATSYRDNGDLQHAALCAQLVTSFEASIVLVCAYDFLADLYIRPDGLEPKSRGVEYALAGANLDVLDGEEFNEDSSSHIAWRKCFSKLGYCYAEGVGVGKDGSKAFMYSQRAALYNDVVGMFNLGDCYEHGVGTEQSKKDALGWYKASADAGFEHAQKEYNRLLAEMGGTSSESSYSSSSSTSASNRATLSEEDLIDW